MFSSGYGVLFLFYMQMATKCILADAGEAGVCVCVCDMRFSIDACVCVWGGGLGEFHWIINIAKSLLQLHNM